MTVGEHYARALGLDDESLARAAVERSRAYVEQALALVYARGDAAAAAVAAVCDEDLDPSGAMLGRVRRRVAANRKEIT